MTVHQKTIQVTSHGQTPSFLDITDQLRSIVEESGVTTGICSVVSPHTTCSVYFDEFAHDLADEFGTDALQADFNRGLDKVFPAQNEMPPADGYTYPGEAHYQAVESWPNAAEYLPDGDRRQLLNADAHLKSSLIGTSQTFAVIDGKLGFGVTGYVYFVDWDRSRARTRKCHITIIGE